MKILFVDDEDMILTTISRFLKRAIKGIEIETASDGIEALNKIESGYYDLLITNQNMPEMTGLELIEAIKIKFSQMPIILFSGYFNEENTPTGVIFIQKPCDINYFLEVVKKCLRCN